MPEFNEFPEIIEDEFETCTSAPHTSVDPVAGSDHAKRIDAMWMAWEELKIDAAKRAWLLAFADREEGTDNAGIQ